MRAELIHENHLSWLGNTHIYKLNPSLKGYDYIAVSVHNVDYGQWHNAGVEVVGCNEHGTAAGPSVEPLWQSYVVLSHDEIITELGYTL